MMSSPRGWSVSLWCLLLCCHAEAWRDTCIIGCECSGTTIECRHLDRKTFPADLDPDTEILRIRDSKISYIQQNALAKMRNLRVLEISSSDIIYIQTCAFAEVSNFTSIKFSKNNITNVVQNAFAVVANVNELVFEDSRVETISTQAFTQLRDVKTFILSNLTVNKLEREAIDDVSGISNFQIDFNKFGYVGQSPLNSLFNVTLNISQNIFPSHCGVGDVLSDLIPETNVVIHFQNNVIQSCACNMSLIGAQRASFISMDQNTCSGPPEIAGEPLLELADTPFCRATATNRTSPLWCPVTRRMSLLHNCHAFGSPLIPQEEVKDPRYDKGQNDNNGAPNCNLSLFSISCWVFLCLYSWN
ncbi:vasorin-like [Ylistrum balloti]|uniref:vasorin-like n=1 Tax=Ylistrum balloti TaxID=509963 RepID=UPI0029059B43|nr:vasorin-like [Ylistrum balloti]